MAKAFITLSFFIIPLLVCSQDDFIIRGKIELLSTSDSVILASGFGTFKSKVNSNGDFVISGKGIKTANEALIYTDSSSANAIFLQPGEYRIECKEIRVGTNPRPILRITKLVGPKDAEIIHGYQNQLMDFNINVPRETRLQMAQSFIVGYIDSIFKHYRNSAALPKIVGWARPTIGDDAAQVYYSLLSNGEIVYPDGIGELAKYFKRKEKIQKEIYFQDFQMKDKNDKKFTLSSVNKKLILIDFWSTDCAPCRRNHPKLVDLYNKYSAKGLEIISISLDFEKKEWLDAIKKDKMTWINVSELKGWQNTVYEAYFIGSIPFSFLLDKDRKIIGAQRLFTDEDIEKYFK